MADGEGKPAFKARTFGSIRDFDAADWNALANPPGAPCNPFVSHEFLSALERSKSATPESGWTPAHIALDESGALVGAAPVYLKAHSYGEYVFDHHWADAFERAGGRYYPKILCASPFTPVPGPRLLAETPGRRAALASALVGLAKETRASSAHVNFIGAADAAALEGMGFLTRRGVQYHWFNRGYKTYEDFLAALASRKRKALRRERREAAGGLEIRRLVGREIGERRWDAFWTFYQDTGGRKWGRPYLTRAFFREIAETMADQILLVVAEDRGRAIAGALNFIGGDALYGRYWGRTEERPFLHFELCYHQAIEFAIERGLARVEAGAQGEHKIARGYEPVATYSAHWIANPGLRRAIEHYLEAERREIDAEIAAIDELTPFRKDA
ncbi:MAG: GNAT family N-acetyltransferase [Pseudomonadota bacterium]